MSKTMFVLMSHQMTALQEDDARKNLGIEKFIIINEPIWSNIPADATSVMPSIEPIKKIILRDAKEGDVLFVQGDFGATVAMVHFAKQEHLLAVHSTTVRVCHEVVEGEKTTTVREFKHVRFRNYE